jgi:hypothetical protein
MNIERIKRAPAALMVLARQLRRHEGGRNTVSYLKRLGLTHTDAIDVARQIKRLATPLASFERSRTAGYLDGQDEIRVPRDKAYLRVPDGYLEGVDRVVAHCEAIFRQKESEIVANYKPPYGMAIRFVEMGASVKMENPDEIRPIFDFCAQPRLFRLLTEYMGEFPVMANVSLIYTMPNTETIGSQLFHRDMNERRQLHMVIPIRPIDLECGPFTFIPADRSAEVVRALKLTESGRIDDRDIFSVCRDDELVRITGEPGDVYLVNPYRCIHFGARARSKSRLILIVNFTSLFEAAEGQHAVYRSSNKRALDNGRTESRWLLNI